MSKVQSFLSNSSFVWIDLAELAILNNDPTKVYPNAGLIFKGRPYWRVGFYLKSGLYSYIDCFDETLAKNYITIIRREMTR